MEETLKLLAQFAEFVQRRNPDLAVALIREVLAWAPQQGISLGQLATLLPARTMVAAAQPSSSEDGAASDGLPPNPEPGAGTCT
jgi:hypothetical protein